jgi:hypothetical protein
MHRNMFLWHRATGMLRVVVVLLATATHAVCSAQVGVANLHFVTGLHYCCCCNMLGRHRLLRARSAPCMLQQNSSPGERQRRHVSKRGRSRNRCGVDSPRHNQVWKTAATFRLVQSKFAATVELLTSMQLHGRHHRWRECVATSWRPECYQRSN